MLSYNEAVANNFLILHIKINTYINECFSQNKSYSLHKMKFLDDSCTRITQYFVPYQFFSLCTMHTCSAFFTSQSCQFTGYFDVVDALTKFSDSRSPEIAFQRKAFTKRNKIFLEKDRSDVKTLFTRKEGKHWWFIKYFYL